MSPRCSSRLTRWCTAEVDRSVALPRSVKDIRPSLASSERICRSLDSTSGELTGRRLVRPGEGLHEAHGGRAEPPALVQRDDGVVVRGRPGAGQVGRAEVEVTTYGDHLRRDVEVVERRLDLAARPGPHVG